MTDDIIEQAARVLCALEYGDPDDPILEYDDCGQVTTYAFAWTYYAGHAQALADAGLLTRTLPTRDEIAMAMYNVLDSQYGDFCIPDDAADAVLELLKGQDR